MAGYVICRLIYECRLIYIVWCLTHNCLFERQPRTPVRVLFSPYGTLMDPAFFVGAFLSAMVNECYGEGAWWARTVYIHRI